MPGDAAHVGDDGPDAVHDRHIGGRGLPGHQDGALGHGGEVVVAGQNEGLACGAACGGHGPAAQDDLAAVQGLVVFGRFVGQGAAIRHRGLLHAKGPGLEDEQALLLVLRPLDVQRKAGVLLQLEPVGGQLQQLGLVQAAFGLHGPRHVLHDDALATA